MAPTKRLPDPCVPVVRIVEVIGIEIAVVEPEPHVIGAGIHDDVVHRRQARKQIDRVHQMVMGVQPIDARVGHPHLPATTQGIIEVLLEPRWPSLRVVENGVGRYLRDPSKAGEGRVVFE